MSYKNRRVCGEEESEVLTKCDVKDIANEAIKLFCESLSVKIVKNEVILTACGIIKKEKFTNCITNVNVY